MATGTIKAETTTIETLTVNQSAGMTSNDSVLSSYGKLAILSLSVRKNPGGFASEAWTKLYDMSVKANARYQTTVNWGSANLTVVIDGYEVSVYAHNGAFTGWARAIIPFFAE